MKKEKNHFIHEIFWELCLKIPHKNAAIVEEFNLKSGAVGFHEILYQEGEIEDLETSVQYYYFRHNFPVKAYIVMTLALLKLEDCFWEVRETKYEDFLKNMRETFKSFEIAPHFWVIPDWESKTFIKSKSENDKFIIIRPAFAFGTGLHETTKLMIEMMLDDKYGVMKNDRALDMGCGSGILSISALIFGAQNAIGVDNDILSVESSIENLGYNTALQKIQDEALFFEGDFSFYSSYYKNHPQPDIFLSNILPDVFMQNENEMKEIINKIPRLILSGIVEERAKEFQNWLEKIAPERKFHSKNLGGWFVFYSKS
ncbi:MAG: 50S ribosomal protein L11 methyltransferase [Spirochaetia bacterium]|nr:50S ribosomal protein L11 methyltransferase [Spirochaetia bacterium]